MSGLPWCLHVCHPRTLLCGPHASYSMWMPGYGGWNNKNNCGRRCRQTAAVGQPASAMYRSAARGWSAAGRSQHCQPCYLAPIVLRTPCCAPTCSCLNCCTLIPLQWCALMERCWAQSPADRPAMAEVTSALRAMVVTLRPTQRPPTSSGSRQDLAEGRPGELPGSRQGGSSSRQGLPSQPSGRQDLAGAGAGRQDSSPHRAASASRPPSRAGSVAGTVLGSPQLLSRDASAVRPPTPRPS